MGPFVPGPGRLIIRTAPLQPSTPDKVWPWVPAAPAQQYPFDEQPLSSTQRTVFVDGTVAGGIRSACESLFYVRICHRGPSR